MKVVLAEKKIQAEELAKPFPHKMAQGYIEISPCSTFPQGGVMVWASGHLVSLLEPEEYDEKFKKWDLQDLPIIPTEFKYHVDRTKSKLFAVIKRFVKDPKTSEIIIATDPGREGELIAGLILQQAGNKKPTKRLWTSSLTKKSVEDAFNNLLPGKTKENLFYEAYSRQCADWLIGMNTSRLYSILLRGKAEGSFSTGRVQSALLSLLVERDVAISKFVPKPFWQVYATLSIDGKEYKGKWFKDDLTDLPARQISEELAQACKNKSAEVRDVKFNRTEYKPPLLHNLSSVQTAANKLYRYSPAETTKVLQGLYERKITSYARTDSQYITEGEARQLPGILSKLQQLKEYAPLLPAPQPELIGNTRYVNPNKVTDHYAIIPTENVPNLSDLKNEQERNLYDMIVRSVIAAHYPNAIIDYTTIVTYVDSKFSFLSKGKVTVASGWKNVIYPLPTSSEDDLTDDDETTLPQLAMGEKGTAIHTEVKEGKTQPPKRYTEGDLISLMKNAGKHIDDKDYESIMQSTGGLGTEATRAGMIDRLKSQKYIEVKKNKVFTTEKGKLLVEAIGPSLLTSAEMTAQWETKLRDISNGQYPYKAFVKEVQEQTKELVRSGYSATMEYLGKGKSTQITDKQHQSTPISDPPPARVQPVIESKPTVAQPVKQQASSPEQPRSVESKPSEPNPSPVVDQMTLKAMWVVVQAKQGSVSLIQRKLGVGYTEAAKLIDALEALGVVSKFLGSMPREVYMNTSQFQEKYPHLFMRKVEAPVAPVVREPERAPIVSVEKPQPSVAVEKPADQSARSVNPEVTHQINTSAPQAKVDFPEQPKKVQQNYPPAGNGGSVQRHQQKPSQQPSLNMNDLGLCPKCASGHITDKGKFYGCSAYHQTACDYTIGKIIMGVDITREDIQTLLLKGETSLKRGFTSKKSNTPFDAYMTLGNEGKLDFKRPEPRKLLLPGALLKKQSLDQLSQDSSKEIEWIETATEMMKMPARVEHVAYGPKVVRFEMLPVSMNINISKYRRYKDNFKAVLEAETITIYSPIPGSKYIGIEIPNKQPYTVNLRSMLENPSFINDQGDLTFAIGVDMTGSPQYADLAKMPHLLIAGVTGAGKSVYIDSFILSLIFRKSPAEMKFMMIDPKMVELSKYENLPHLYCPIITDPKLALRALQRLTREMDRRYAMFVEMGGVRNIKMYNEKLLRQDPKAEKLPYIILIIDELADLMMLAPRDVEDEIQRLSQLARGAGIHLVVATQRPTKAFISPNIKSNMPVRIAFAVSATNDSMVILDEPGAEDLLGQGDMYFKPKDRPRQRLVSAYVSDEEIENVMRYITQKNPYHL